MPAAPISIRAYGRLLRDNRNVRLLWMAQIVSEVGDWFYSVAVYNLLLELTGQASSVANAIVLQVLPQTFVAPLAGVINDRISRRTVMIVADLARAAIVLCMLVAQSVQWVWLIYVLLFLETLMWGMFEPGRSATIPNLTRDREEMAVANTLGSTTWSLNFTLGFFLGGVVAAVFGRSTVYLLNALSFVASALLLRRMRFSEPHTHEAAPLRAAELLNITPVAEGLRYVRRDPRLLATLLCKAGIGFMGAHWVILPILGERVFPVAVGGIDASRAGMLGMSVLLGCRGVGAIVGPLLGGYVAGSDPARMRRWILYGFIALGIGYGCLSIAPNLALACAAIVIGHAGPSIVWVFSTTLLQEITDDKFRGRVFSADFAALTIAMSVVTQLGGLAIDRGWSPQSVALATGLTAVIPATLWGLVAMPLWRR